MSVTVIINWPHAKRLEFEGIQFDVSSNPGGTPNLIGWMSDWDAHQAWIDRGLIEEKWYPHSYHHTDSMWAGEIPATEPALKTSTYEVRVDGTVVEVEAYDIIDAFKVARKLYPGAVSVCDTAV